jgi:phosphomevalonate kinase
MAVVSAPGKVLLAGGYLVLDRAYTGLVFGLSARIHVVVRDSPDKNNTPPSSSSSSPEILVQSPQFRDASWAYSYRAAAHDGGIDVIQEPG